VRRSCEDPNPVARSPRRALVPPLLLVGVAPRVVTKNRAIAVAGAVGMRPTRQVRANVTLKRVAIWPKRHCSLSFRAGGRKLQDPGT
jgi:hypothetical protein